jgi:hypothetical protein
MAATTASSALMSWSRRVSATYFATLRGEDTLSAAMAASETPSSTAAS